jgi:hypothetical protein
MQSRLHEVFVGAMAEFSETLRKREDEWEREVVDAIACAARVEEEIATVRMQNRLLMDELASLEGLRSQLGASLAKNVSLSLAHARKECKVQELAKKIAQAARSETETRETQTRETQTRETQTPNINTDAASVTDLDESTDANTHSEDIPPTRALLQAVA